MRTKSTLVAFLFSFTVAGAGTPARGVNYPAIPILLVHGLNSSAQVWQDSLLLPFFESFYGWTVGAPGECVYNFRLGRTATTASLTTYSELTSCPSTARVFRLNFEAASYPGFQDSNCASVFLQSKAIQIAIADIKSRLGVSKVLVMGHSMGGLAAANYILGDGDNNGVPDFYRHDVAKIVTLGTPFGGSYQATLSGFLSCTFGSNAERDLRRAGDNGPNPFLYGGNEDTLVNDYWKDVNANCPAGSGACMQEAVPGLRGQVFPPDVDTFWLVGNATGLGDCVVDADRQVHPVTREFKVIDAYHSAVTPCGNRPCSEPQAFRPIVEAMDEADVKSLAWPVTSGLDLTGFITHPGDTETQAIGTDHDWFAFPAMLGTGSLTFTAGDVAIDQLEVRDQNNRVILQSTSLQRYETFSTGLAFPASSTTGYIHVVGRSSGSPSGIGVAGVDACASTAFLPVDAPYHFRVIAPSPPAVSLTANPPLVLRPGSTTLQVSLVDSQGGPVASTLVWLRSPLPAGTYSGCTITGAGCETNTNGSGVATISYTPSADGTASFTATSALGGLASLQVSVGSGALTVAATPSSVVVNSSTTLTATVGGGVTPLAGRTVTFSTTHPALFFGTGCTFSPCTAITNASGIATIGLTPSASGTAQVSVSSPDLQGTIVAIPVSPPSSNFAVTLAVFFQNGDASASNYEVEATVRTVEGQPIVGERVDWTTTRGSLANVWSSTASTGIAQTHLTVTNSGATSVIATVRGVQFTTTFQAQVGTSGSGPMVPVRQLTVGSAAVYGLTWAANGSILVAADYNGSVRAWDAATGGVLWSATASDNNVGQVAASPDGSRILVGNSDGFDVYQATNGQVLATVDFVPSADRIVNSALLSNTTFIRNDRRSLFTHGSLSSAGSSVYTVPTADDDFDFSGRMAWSPSRSWVAAVNSSGVIFVNSSSNGSLVRREDMGSGSAARGAGDTAFDSTSSRLLATAFNTIRVYDLTAGTWTYVSYTAQGLGNNEKLGATFLDNDNKLAIGGGGKVEVLSRLDGSSFRLGTVPGWAWEIAWNQSRQELAVGSDSGSVTIFQPLAPVDSSAPGINVSTPIDQAVTFASAVTTAGQVSDASAISTFTINGANTSLGADRAFSASVSLAAGANVLTYVATDAAGNVGTVQRTVTRVLDTSPPTISGVTASPGVVTLGAQVTVSASIVDGDTGVASGQVLLRNASGTLIATIPLVHGSGSSYACTLSTATYGSGGFVIDVRATDSSAQANQATSAGVASFQVQTPAALRLGTSTLDFGNVVAGSSTTASVTIYNDGQAALNGMATTAPPFGLVSATSFVIQGGGSTQIVVRFTPLGVVTYSGSVAFSGGGGSSLTLLGKGTVSPGQMFRDGFETGDKRAWLSGP